MKSRKSTLAVAGVAALALLFNAGVAQANLNIPVDTKIKPVVDVEGYDTTSITLFGEQNDFVDEPLSTGSKDAFLTCVVDKPVYNIGYTGWLDMKPVVEGWNNLRQAGLAYADVKSREQLVNVNDQLGRLGWNRIVWGQTPKAEAEKLISDLNARYAGTPAWQDVPLWLATEEETQKFWLEVFMQLKVGSNFVISFNYDPTVVDINVPLWKAKLDEAYKAGNTHTTFDDHMRPYDVAVEGNVVKMFFRVKHANPAEEFNASNDYNTTNRDVFARDLDFAYNGADHTFENFSEPDELTFLQITTPPGVLTVSEENYRKVEGLDPLALRKFVANTPRVTGEFLTPISNESRAHAAMPTVWSSTWNITFNQNTNNDVVYLTRTSVGVDHVFTGATNLKTGEQIAAGALPAEVTALLPVEQSDLTLDEAKAYTPALAAGTTVETADGTWTFKGFAPGTDILWTTHNAVDAEKERTVNQEVGDCKHRGFEGAWEFQPKPEPKPEAKPEPKPEPKDSLAKTGVESQLLLGAAGALILGSGAMVLRRRKA